MRLLADCARGSGAARMMHNPQMGEVFMREGKLDLAEPVLREAVRSAKSAPFALLPWQVAEAEDALGRCLVAVDRRSEGFALLRASAQGVRAVPRRCRFR